VELWVAARYFSLNLFSNTCLRVVAFLLFHGAEIFALPPPPPHFLFNCVMKCLSEDSPIFFAFPSIVVCTYLAFSL
jgi:hypothetical protein